MRHNYSLIAIIALLMSALTTQTALAETKSPQLISLLNGFPKTDKTNCDASDLMSLLTAESLQWVESIECENVNLSTSRVGVELGSISNGGTSSYIKFNFKKENIMKMFRIRAYGVGKDNDKTKVYIYCNENEILDGSWGINNTVYNSTDYEVIETCMSSGSNASSIKEGYGDLLPKYIMNSTVFDNIPTNSVTVSIPYQSVSDKCQFYGLLIFYDGTVDESGSSDLGYQTIVDEVNGTNGNLNVEYFDMMGRRLPEKPKTGIYIRKTGTKTEKLIAH